MIGVLIGAGIIILALLCAIFLHVKSSDRVSTDASAKIKAENFLSNLKQGDTVTVLMKHFSSPSTKMCIVKANMPSLKKIELEYRLVDIWHNVFSYSEIEDGLLDLNDIHIDKNDPFLK